MGNLRYQLKDPTSTQDFRAQLADEAVKKGDNLNVIATPTGSGHSTNEDRFFTLWVLEMCPYPEDFWVVGQDEVTQQWVRITFTPNNTVMIEVISV